MREVNFIIRTNYDCDGITEEIIRELKRKFNIESGLVLDCNCNDRKREENIDYWKVDCIGTHNYLDLYKNKSILEPDLLNKMLPYKSMAMHILMRECDYDIYKRHYLEETYYNHLRFWVDVIDKRKINCIINMTPPHHVGEFILYALAQIKGIPYVFLYPQLTYEGTLSGLGTSLETLGLSIKENYEKKEGLLYTENDISEYMRTAYKSVNNAVIMQANDVEKLYYENRKRSLKFISLRNIASDVLHIACKKIINNKCLDNEIKIGERARCLKLRLDAAKVEKSMDHLEDYKKYSVQADFSKPYVYYAMHMTPEASTMPQSGEYKEQFLSIEILSRLAEELGFDIYIKEHWIQTHRDKDYYKKISEMPRVSLVDIGTNSIELINHSLAVSTQTGNVIFESLIKRKPAVVYSDGYLFKGAPNVIKMESYEQLKITMKKILNKSFEVKEEDVFRYIKAMEEEMIFSYVDSLDETNINYRKGETAEKIVSYLIKYNNMMVSRTI